MTPTPGVRIFLVDDHPAVLDGLALLLAQDRHTICGVAANRAEALARIAPSGADLVLVDLALCGESGLDLLPELSVLGLPVLVYSMHEEGHRQPGFGEGGRRLRDQARDLGRAAGGGAPGAGGGTLPQPARGDLP